MISVVCFMWNEGYRAYAPEHVNILQKMVARHLSLPHQFVCITEETKGFDPEVVVMRTPPASAALGELRSPEGVRFPSCYRRLWMFSPEAVVLGDRALLIDIDLVVTRSLDPLFDRKEAFVGWRPFRDWGKQCRFGGGLYLMTPGSRPQVWTDFNGAQSIAEARRAGFRGSDQAWISYKLGAVEPFFDRSSGIYSIRDFKPDSEPLPNDARIVQLNGPMKPWHKEAKRFPWVSENFR